MNSSVTSSRKKVPDSQVSVNAIAPGTDSVSSSAARSSSSLSANGRFVTETGEPTEADAQPERTSIDTPAAASQRDLLI